MTHTFRHCKICGSPHGNSPCPIREYNAELETRNRERVTAEMLFPGQPGLVDMLKALQARWISQQKTLVIHGAL